MRIQNVRIGQKIAISFGVVALLTVALCGRFYVDLTSVEAAKQTSSHTYKVLRSVDSVLLAIVNMETGVRGFIATRDEATLEPYVAGSRAFADKLAEVRGLTIDNPGQQARLARLKRQFEEMRATVFEPEITFTRDPATREKAEAIIKSGVGKTHMDGIRDLLEQITGEEEALLAQRSDDLQSAMTLSKTLAVGGAVVVLIGASLIGLLMSRMIAAPVVRMTGAMQKLAAGDVQVDVPGVGRGDEIGSMALAVQVFKDNMIRTAALEAETQTARASAEAQRKLTMLELADRFERAVGGIVDTVSSASTELNATAGAMTRSAADTASQATDVSSSAEEASVNVAAVASATEEMGASINEIGRQVHQSAQMCEGAVVEARESARLIQELSNAASRIGDVVSVISDIASQTNLLALNATIEAARAGEAGRGFAVVASEVKQLAAQTAKATAEISSQIESIQDSTGRAVTAVGNIGETIAGLNATAGAISSAVSQQTAATQEIVHNVSEVAMGAGAVTSTITGVARAAGDTGVAASQVLTASGELSQQSEKLRQEMGRFLDTVRAA